MGYLSTVSQGFVRGISNAGRLGEGGEGGKAFRRLPHPACLLHTPSARSTASKYFIPLSSAWTVQTWVVLATQCNLGHLFLKASGSIKENELWSTPTLVTSENHPWVWPPAAVFFYLVCDRLATVSRGGIFSPEVSLPLSSVSLSKHRQAESRTSSGVPVSVILLFSCVHAVSC